MESPKSQSERVSLFSVSFQTLWQSETPEELAEKFVDAARRFFSLKGVAIFSSKKVGRSRILAKSGRFSISVKKFEPWLQQLEKLQSPLWPEELQCADCEGTPAFALFPLNKNKILGVEFRKRQKPDSEVRQWLLHAVAIFRGVWSQIDTRMKQNKQLSELHILIRVSQLLNKSLSLEEFFDQLYQETRQLFQCETHFLGTYDPEEERVTLELFVDEDFVARKKTFLLKDLGLLQHVIKTKAPLVIPDFDLYKGIQPVIYGKRKLSKSWVGIPLLDNGRVLGVMAFGSYTRKIAWQEYLSLLLSLGQIVTSRLKLLQDSQNVFISQKKYSTLFRELPAPAALVGSDGKIFETNEAFTQQIGSLLEGKQNLFGLSLKRDARQRLSHFLREETPFAEWIHLPYKKGFDRHFHLTGRPFSFGEKSRPSMLLIFEDQTVPFRRQQLLFSLYQMTFEIQRARTRHNILKAVVRSLKHLGYHSFIFIYQPGRKTFLLNPHSFSMKDIALFPISQKMKILHPRGGIEIPEAMFAALMKTTQSRKMIFREDAQEFLKKNYPDELVQGILPGFQKLGIKSTLTIPIYSRKKAMGAMVILGEFLSQEEFSIFQNLATAMAIALERAEALQELDLSRRKYQTTLEKAGMALWVTDSEGTLLEMNKAARRLLGKNRTPRTISDLWDKPIEWQPFLLRDRRVEKRFGPVRLLVDEKKSIPVFLVASGFKVENKTFLEWIAWDLRKQERREKEIARRNRELKALYRVGWQLNRSHSIQQLLQKAVAEIMALFNVDACGIYTLENDGRLHLKIELGTPPEYNREIKILSVGEGLAGWIAQSRKPFQVPDLQKCHRITRHVVLERGFQSYAGVPILYGKRLLGTLGFLSLQKRILEKNEMKLLQTMANELGIAIENMRLNERLEEASRRYRHLFHNAVDGMLLVDFDRFQIVEANRYMGEKWNVPFKQLVGRQLFEFVTESDRENLENYLRSLPDQKIRQNLRVHLKGSRGNVFASDIIGGMLKLSGDPFAMLMIRDVTRQIELEEQLRLSQQLAAVGELSAGIAHEIRNPLSAINTSVGLLQYNTNLSQDDQELLRIISEESQRLEKVVSEFIQFARPQKPLPEKLKLSQLILDITRIFQKSGERSVQIVFEKKQDPGYFWFDGNKIRQVVINLIKNSLDAIEKAGIQKGKIDITLNRRRYNGKPFAEVILHDNGPGISKEKQSQIFNPFFSTKPDGLGMGLSISRKIVEQHGGQLFLEQHASNGATFHLLLPIRKKQRELFKGLGSRTPDGRNK